MTYPQFESFPPTVTKKISSTVFAAAETRDVARFRSRPGSNVLGGSFRAHSFLAAATDFDTARTFPASEITYFSFVVLRSILARAQKYYM